MSDMRVYWIRLFLWHLPTNLSLVVYFVICEEKSFAAK